MEYSDMQTRVAEAGEKITDLYLYLANAGQATIEGFELEVTGQPTDNLSVIAIFNYTKGDYQEFDTPAYKDFQVVTIDRSDEPFGGTPEKSASLMVSYDIPAESAGLFVPRLSVVYRDDLYVGLDYLAPEYDQSWLGSYTLVNARLDWMPNDDWTITAFVDNLADENYFQGGYAVMDTLGAATVVKGPGTAYGIIISRDF
jgi:outer membrane receptor protein involved in Fe transport